MSVQYVSNMKILYLSLIAISLSLVMLSTNAEPIGAPGMSFSPFRLHLQKTEYNPGDTLVAQVEDLSQRNTNALIKVSSKNDDNDTNVIYQQHIQFVNGWYEFKYKIPSMPPNSPYSYYVKVYELGSNIPSDKALFFTKENASKITISDLNVNDRVGSDRNLNFEFKISDGLGNMIYPVGADASLPYESCGVWSNQLTSDLLPLIKSNGLMRGNITLPRDFESGTYHLYVYASGEIGYQPIKEQVTFEFHNDTSSVKIADLKTVDPNFFIPYEPSTKIHRLDIDEHKVTVEANDRFCGYEFVPEEKRLTVHVASTGSHQFIRLVIPYDVLSGNMYVLGHDIRLNFDSADSANGTIIAMDHMFGYQDVSVIGTRAIPEFPLVMPVLAISIFSILLFYKFHHENRWDQNWHDLQGTRLGPELK